MYQLPNTVTMPGGASGDMKADVWDTKPEILDNERML